MTKLTKKEFKPAISQLGTDLRRALNTYLLAGGKTTQVTGSYKEWSFKAFGIRRSRVVCNVPTPFSCFSAQYQATHPEYGTFYGENGESLLRNIFFGLVRRGVL